MAEDKKITIVNDQGQKLEVFEKAYKVVYAPAGYRLVSENQEDTESDEINFYDYSREELDKVKNDDLKAFLDQEGIEYASGATKPDLIKLILGENDHE